MKKILMFALSFILIAGGTIFASTYTDVTVTEVNVDGATTTIEVDDIKRDIKKEWQETREELFTVEQKLDRLTDMKNSINSGIEEYNKNIDELSSIKESLNLDFKLPVKLSL
jgi:peptidoglycan hydrolase CwlO-like protein